MTHQHLDLAHINGVKVIARQLMTHVTPISNGKAVPMTYVDEVLLDDGTTIYQCVHPDETEVWVNANAISVRAHLGAHSDKKARRAAEKKLAEQAERRRLGAIQAAKTRAERKAQAKLAADDVAEGDFVDEVLEPELVLSPENPFLDKLMNLELRAGQLHKELQEFRMKVALQGACYATEEMMDKARKYDDLMKMLGR